MTDAEIQERRKTWRHFLQCAFAEQEARLKVKAARGSMANPAHKRRVEAELVAEGTRLDAAIDALDDSFTAALTRPMEGQPQ